MRKVVFVIACFASFTACVPQAPLLKQTASGYPEGVFRGGSLDVVKGKLMEACTSNGLMISEASSNQVVCGKTMEGGSAVLAQMAIGNSYSTTPQQKVRFVMYQLNSDVKVTAQQWIETQMAFGQVQTQELKANNQKNSLQQLLFSLGAE